MGKGDVVRTIEKEMNECGLIGNNIITQAADRQQWGCILEASCADGHDED